MALRAASDRRWGRAASGMPDPEMCISGRDFLCLSGMLDVEKVKKENGFVKLCFTHLYPDGFTALWVMYHCSANNCCKHRFAENRCAENGFVKLRFTHPLAPQVIYR